MEFVLWLLSSACLFDDGPFRLLEINDIKVQATDLTNFFTLLKRRAALWWIYDPFLGVGRAVEAVILNFDAAKAVLWHKWKNFALARWPVTNLFPGRTNHPIVMPRDCTFASVRGKLRRSSVKVPVAPITLGVITKYVLLGSLVVWQSHLLITKLVLLGRICRLKIPHKRSMLISSFHIIALNFLAFFVNKSIESFTFLNAFQHTPIIHHRKILQGLVRGVINHASVAFHYFFMHFWPAVTIGFSIIWHRSWFLAGGRFGFWICSWLLGWKFRKPQKWVPWLALVGNHL